MDLDPCSHWVVELASVQSDLSSKNELLVTQNEDLSILGSVDLAGILISMFVNIPGSLYHMGVP